MEASKHWKVRTEVTQRDSWRNSTITDCFNSETRGKNVTCTDSYASGENLEKCDSS